MYKFILAIRYLLKRKVSSFAVLAVALSVFVVLVVITVLSGLVRDFKDKMYGFTGDCVVSSRSMVGFPYYEEFMEKLQGQEIIEAVSPVIETYAIVFAGEGNYQNDGVIRLIGIDPQSYGRVTEFNQWLWFNKDTPQSAFVCDYDPNLTGCVPGVHIMFHRDERGQYPQHENAFRMAFDVGCVPLTPKGALARAGAGEINTKTFYYSDIAKTGIARVDGNILFVPFEDAQALCGMNIGAKRTNLLYIKFKEGVSVSTGTKKVKAMWKTFTAGYVDDSQAFLLANVRVQDWKNYSRIFIAAVETEQTIMSVVFGLIGVITVFIVFVIFYMIVCHKSKDIGILKSIGVSRGGIFSVFLLFAFFIAAIGSVIGAIGGWQFLVHINQLESWLYEHFKFQLWNRAFYAIDEIPNTISPEVLIGTLSAAVLVCLIGALVPSWQAGRFEPVETLRVAQI